MDNNDLNDNDGQPEVEETSDTVTAQASEGPSSSSIFSALSAGPYRRFWFGSLASVGGTQLLIIGQGVLVFDLSGSEFLLGLAGAVTGIATILVTIFGGVVADRVNKRGLMILTSLTVSALLFLLASIDATEIVKVWHVIVIASIIGIVTGFDQPARLSFFPLLIQDRSQMMSAVALNSILWQGTRIIVPAIGGFAIAFIGTYSIFYASSAGFFTMFLVLLTLKPYEGEKTEGRNLLGQLWGGVQYIRKNRLFATLVPFTYCNFFFGLSYLQLIPVFSDAYGGQAGQALGFLLMSAGIGAVIGTITTGWFRSTLPVGRLMLSGSAMTAVMMIAFAVWTRVGPDPLGSANPVLSPMFFISAFLIMVAAISNSIFLITSMTILQLKVPLQLRGRVMGIHAMTFSLVAVGGLFMGGIAELTNVSFSVGISAIVLLIAVSFIFLTQPFMRNLRSH